MKITDGMWLIREGMDPHYAAEAYDVAATPDGLTVYAPERRVDHRGSVLNTALLTVRLTAPLPGIIGVEVAHHSGGADRGPRFGLAQDGSHRPETAITDDIAEVRSGSLTARVRRGAPWHLEFSHDGQVLTTNGVKALGFVNTAAGEHHMFAQLSLGVGETVYGLGERFTAFVRTARWLKPGTQTPARPASRRTRASRSTPSTHSSAGWRSGTSRSGCFTSTAT